MKLFDFTPCNLSPLIPTSEKICATTNYHHAGSKQEIISSHTKQSSMLFNYSQSIKQKNNRRKNGQVMWHCTSTLQTSRILKIQHTNIKRVYDRFSRVKRNLSAIRLRKRQLIRLIEKRRMIPHSSSSHAVVVLPRKNAKISQEDKIKIYHARAQTLRQKLIEGVARAQRQVYEDRVRRATVVRNESKIISRLIVEMKEKELKRRQRLRRRVLCGKQYASHDINRFEKYKCLSYDNRRILDDIQLYELQQELKLAQLQETCLNDELLEIKELLGCLTLKESIET